MSQMKIELYSLHDARGMRLRELEIKDAPLMFEWMHDENVTRHLRTNFRDKTLFDAEDFIRSSQVPSKNINLAVVSGEDEYMGTVTLRHIDRGKRWAEFAIVVRSVSMGRGYAWYGMQAILCKAFDELDLDRVYWCVSKENNRAVRFYDKHGFQETATPPLELLELYPGVEGLRWYSVAKDTWGEGLL